MTSHGCQTALSSQTVAFFPEQATKGNMQRSWGQGGGMPAAGPDVQPSLFAEHTKDSMWNEHSLSSQGIQGNWTDVLCKATLFSPYYLNIATWIFLKLQKWNFRCLMGRLLHSSLTNPSCPHAFLPLSPLSCCLFLLRVLDLLRAPASRPLPAQERERGRAALESLHPYGGFQFPPRPLGYTTKRGAC